MAGELEALFDELFTWQKAGRRVALATVIRTFGSSPRVVGSHLAVDERGNFSGSVSGGCVEGAVIEQALSIIDGAPAQRLDFDIANPQAWDVGLTCGGRIAIYVERLDARHTDLLYRTLDSRAQRRPAALITRLRDGAHALLEADFIDDEHALLRSESTRAGALQLLRSGQSGLLEEAADAIFVRTYACPARLFLIGAVHIAQILAPLALQVGLEPLVIDPRVAYATAARFGAIALNTDWPDAALQRAGIDARDAVVTLTHDPKLDDPALTVALRSPAFYIGALGSQRSHAQRIERLRELAPDAAVERIHGPVGLPLGGRAPAEIAVSIMAHLIEQKYAS